MWTLSLEYAAQGWGALFLVKTTKLLGPISHQRQRWPILALDHCKENDTETEISMLFYSPNVFTTYLWRRINTTSSGNDRLTWIQSWPATFEPTAWTEVQFFKRSRRSFKLMGVSRATHMKWGNLGKVVRADSTVQVKLFSGVRIVVEVGVECSLWDYNKIFNDYCC
jgi:hypothetical protein